MKNKIYCSQCHNSTFTHARFGNRFVAAGQICLYCFKKKQYMPRNAEINDCRKLTPESREKYLAGVWNANIACFYEK